MATKKTPQTDADALAMPGASDSDFDQAVDDLRGVLKADADGGHPDIGSDFGDFGGLSDDKSDPLAAFESDFGGAAATPDAGFGMDDLGGGSDFGGGDFGGGDLGGSSFGGDTSFGNTGSTHQEPGSGLTANLDLIMDIPIDVEIVLGTSRMQVSGLMTLEEGATIALDKKIGEPVEIVVNGRRIGKGEITVLENDETRFGVRLTEVLSTRRT